MGTYLNPGNNGFAEIVSSDYVDKTEMISLINNMIDTKEKLICISRPRRFGKSYAAQMLCAYYDKTCDSDTLFSNYKISHVDSYKKFLNKYDVIYLDMAGIKPYTDKFKTIVPFIIDVLTKEIKNLYPQVNTDMGFPSTLVDAVEKSGNKFFIIIDEWDAPIRETPEIQEDYLDFLRSLFKNSGITSKVFAAAYMTGILPIKKDGNQSAVSDFDEYSVLEPGCFAGYVGFTEDEVKNCCLKSSVDFEKMKKWYDGYTMGKLNSIYNPYSVMEALHSCEFKSYWKKTSAVETLITYIDMDQDGLQEEIIKLIAGESIAIDSTNFQNDVESFTSRDDVLTLLVHLGYLTYEELHDPYSDNDSIVGLVHIPNEEVRTEFESILRKSKHKKLIQLISYSDKLLADTISGKEDDVAKAIQKVHDSSYAPAYYNNEQSLRYVIKMAYISCIDQYSRVEELPSGHGLADIVFLPNRRSTLPAMIVELKWNQTKESALKQIKDKNYPAVINDYGGEIILVGINYDKTTKAHSCRIDRLAK